jgi:WhiB family redox-sensing transcriptional regulator
VNVADVFASLRGMPRLPGALCRNHSDLFDPPEHGVDHTDTRERLSFAIRVCCCCPALSACRRWVDSIDPKDRPPGVVAGQTENRR